MGAYIAGVADPRPLSVTKVMAAAGGSLLIASFFLPLLNTAGGADVGREVFGVKDLRAEIEEVREIEAARPFIEPALQQLELFSATPSLRNLSALAAAAGEVADAAIGFGVADPQLPKVARILGLVRTCLWLLPLVGLVQLVAPLVSLLRGYAGFFALVARFAFGLLFALVVLIPLAGLPEADQDLLGPAVSALVAGSLLMMAASVFGVTRSNWWAVLAADVALLVGAGVGLVALADSLGP